jgi:hypothetical protein
VTRGVGAAIFLVVMAVSFVAGQNAAADSNRPPNNTAEAFAQTDCYAGKAAGTYFSRGVFWANNGGGTFSQTVNIAYNATGWVNATLYTGAFACGAITQYNPTTEEMISNDTARLRLTGTKLQRDYTHSPYNFTDPMSSMPIKINVTGLATGDYEIGVSGRLYYATSATGPLMPQLYATNTVRIHVQRALKFNLTPSVSVPSQDLAPGTVTIKSVTPKVTNAGPSNSYPGTDWQLVRFILPSGIAPKSDGTSATTPCLYYTGAPCGGTTKVVSSGRNLFKVVPQTVLAAQDDMIVGLAQGQKVCYATAVKGYDEAHNPLTTTDYRYGTPVCIQVAKKPKVQIWGGDLRTRGNITTSVSTMGGAQYGSWVEYAAFSAGSNASYNFASGSGFAGGTTTSIPQHNLLTFANTPAGSYGKYSLPAMPNVAAQFTGATPLVPSQPAITASSLSLSGYATGTYQLTDNNVTLTASNLKGTSIVLIAPAGGMITIAGDIMYSAPDGSNTFADAAQLPQLVIIAKTITIARTVKTVNAWLLTSSYGNGNSINTCSDPAPLTAAVCQIPLTINGPIMTDTLYLRRTGGSDSLATANLPAETFNLRGDAYLWVHGKTTRTGRVQTVQLSEVPPRF